MAAALHSLKFLAVCWKYIVYLWNFCCRTFLRKVIIIKNKECFFGDTEREISGQFLPERENIWSHIVWITNCQLPLKMAHLGQFQPPKKRISIPHYTNRKFVNPPLEQCPKKSLDSMRGGYVNSLISHIKLLKCVYSVVFWRLLEAISES